MSLPYGSENLSVEIPDSLLAGILVSGAHDYMGKESEIALVEKALAEPIASAPLADMAKGKKEVVVISSDHTRPVPSQVTMPLLLSEIRRGNPAAKITILVATGYHRAPTEAELRQKYGNKIVDEERIVIHRAGEKGSLVKIGILPSGGELIVNKLAVNADLLVAEGFIEPHFFAGFSGGRKSILPGIAGKETVLANHCAAFIDHERARTGVLAGNPIHEDMLFAAKTARLAFILNVVIDGEKKVIKAFAGHFEEAHRKGCEFVRSIAEVKARPAEIVITTNGGYPLDQNIYQAVKSMTAAEATCKPGGVIIVISQCADGHGGEAFYHTFADAASLEEIRDEIKNRTAAQTAPDQWQSQILARILLKHQIIMVTEAPRKMVEAMHLKWAPSVEAALSLAEDIVQQEKSKITVIPDGVSVIVHP